jgi:hypothetical protein
MLSDLSEAFGLIFGGLPSYKDGVISRPSYVDNGKGTLTKTTSEAPVKVQVDRITQFMRVDGFAEDDVQLIILSAGLRKWLDNGRIQDDDEVAIPELGVTYRISGPTADPMNSHWVCRGRIKPV